MSLKNNKRGEAILKKRIAEITSKYSNENKMPNGAKERLADLRKQLTPIKKQIENNKESIKKTGTTSANDTEDPRSVKTITKRSANNQKGPIKKGPVVTPKMIKDAGVTNLRDYYNKKQNKTRKPDVKTKIAKGTALGNSKLNDAQRNVVINEKKQTTKDKNIKKIVIKKKINNKNTFSNDQNIKSKNKMVSKNTSGGIDEAKGDNSKPKKSIGSKIMGFFKGEGNKIKKDFKKAVKETKRNFGPGKNKLSTKGTSNITNSSTYKKKVVPTKKKDSMGEEKIKPSKNMGMDSMMPSKKKKSNSVTYSSNGSKIKMAKGYSSGGRIFTGR